MFKGRLEEMELSGSFCGYMLNIVCIQEKGDVTMLKIQITEADNFVVPDMLFHVW